jgi:hypothetical protein
MKERKFDMKKISYRTSYNTIEDGIDQNFSPKNPPRRIFEEGCDEDGEGVFFDPPLMVSSRLLSVQQLDEQQFTFNFVID